MKKKIILFICILCLLCGCEKKDKDADINDNYNNMIELIKKQENFLSFSDYFNIETEITKIESGYRFYVVVDKPKIAMYNISAIAIENDVDYSENMAATIGVFETTQYNMIPNQANVDKGFVKGVVISGTCANSETSIYVLVTWENKDLSYSTSQYFKFDLKYNEDYVNQEALNG